MTILPHGLGLIHHANILIFYKILFYLKHGTVHAVSRSYKYCLITIGGVFYHAPEKTFLLSGYIRFSRLSLTSWCIDP